MSRTLDQFVMAIFILEIVVKLVAEGNRPLQFFTDAWNVFDFLIVVVGLLPFGGSAVTALRLVRLLRVLKLVSVGAVVLLPTCLNCLTSNVRRCDRVFRPSGPCVAEASHSRHGAVALPLLDCVHWLAARASLLPVRTRR